MIDQQLLRLMKYRNNFYKLMYRVPDKAIDRKTLALLRDFQKYFTKYPEADRIDQPTFMTLFKSWHPTLTDEHLEAYHTIIAGAMQDVHEDVLDGLVYSLMELRLGNSLAELMIKFDEGDVDNFYAAMDELMAEFRTDTNVRGTEHVVVDPKELLARETDDSGIRYRLSCLNEGMRPLQPGDFGIVAGRPDQGKTTMLVSELTHMASQTDKPILWLNNEGPGDRIYSRLWQAALGMPMGDLVKRSQDGTLEQAYMRATKAKDMYKIKVIDVHGQDTYAIERILEQERPAVVVYDMIDNVRGFGSEARTDLALEKMYQWARELCVKYSCAGIATSQISADGAGEAYPQMHMLKDSKTGKQGACDFIIMIGSLETDGQERIRYISVPKNKLRREGSSPVKSPVKFSPQIARYEDVPVSTDGDL